MQISITKHSIRFLKPKPKFGSGIGFQFHILGTKENIFSQKIFWVKNHVFLPKITIFWNFQKVSLRLQRYTSSIMSTFLQCDAPVRGDKLQNKRK